MMKHKDHRPCHLTPAFDITEICVTFGCRAVGHGLLWTTSRKWAFLALKKGLSVALMTMVLLSIAWIVPAVAATNTVRIGFNYPQTGPYSDLGKYQLRSAEMAAEEINAQGGILGLKIELVKRDSASNVRRTKGNIKDLLENEKVRMIFGGVSSAVAIAACEMCQQHTIPFFGTLTYSTATTGEEGHRACFREPYNSWMAAKLIADYTRQHYKGKRFFYITANYIWGWTMEENLRLFTGTTDKKRHQSMRTPLGTNNFIRELRSAQSINPDVLILALGGKDMVSALRQATVMGLKDHCQIVVPSLTLGMAHGAGPEAMDGVIGALPWTWRVPYTYGYQGGIEFVERFKKRYNAYPTTSAASAYTILFEYKTAVERAGSFGGSNVIRALEGHTYQWTKDQQTWRQFDHQSIQSVYLVKGNPADVVAKDTLGQDYFEILHSMPGSQAARTHEQWQDVRRKAGKPLQLEPLPGE